MEKELTHNFLDKEVIESCVIVSIYMDNINPTTVELQQKVVDKHNPFKFPKVNVLTPFSHGQTMNLLWEHEEFKKFKAIMFLDIDAIPLSDVSLALYFDRALKGSLIGNAQRSNHIQNDQHIFCAPSTVCMSRSTFEKIGKPSAEPNYRGDVAEEYTFRAEENAVSVEIIMPLGYDRPVNRMPWETDKSSGWKLKDGQPEYGLGTSYGMNKELPLFWHSFQIFHPGHQELFWKRCEEELRK